MISVEEASDITRQKLSLSPAHLVRPVVADRCYPPINRSMLDGIALNFAAYESGQRDFPIQGQLTAGTPTLTLTQASGCYEIMTGASVPNGCDLVIGYEDLLLDQGRAHIKPGPPRAPGENIHFLGSDCQKGELVLKAGSLFHGPHAGIAASMGVRPIFSKRHKILLISTGDELVDVDQAPLDHQLRRSNVYALKASLEMNVHCEVELAHLRDDIQEISEHYSNSAGEFDVMIYSGGVSKGKFDFLPQVWASQGVECLFHQVAQRPGKPLWFGEDKKHHTILVGLPGNPVSSLVCLHRYFIRGPERYVRLTEDVTFKKPLTYFVPVKIFSHKDGSMWGVPLKIKNSGEFTALAYSDGVIELGAKDDIFKAGEAFSFYGWRT
jgi:molybdopterin molybdotransferase